MVDRPPGGHDQTAISGACEICNAALDLVPVTHADRAVLYFKQ
jgi:hypothetical protein